MARLIRYLYQSGHFSVKNGRVKRNGIMPQFQSHSGRFESSVFFTDGIDEAAIWTLDPKGARLVKARADFLKEIVEKIGLDLDRDDDPPLHANIINWPEEVALQREWAQRIADQASLTIRPVDIISPWLLGQSPK